MLRGVGAAELGPRGKFRYIFTSKPAPAGAIEPPDGARRGGGRGRDP
jgi:hypothetical protein